MKKEKKMRRQVEEKERERGRRIGLLGDSAEIVMLIIIIIVDFFFLHSVHSFCMRLLKTMRWKRLAENRTPSTR